MKSSHSYHKHSVQALVFLMGMILFPLQGLSQTSTTNPTLSGSEVTVRDYIPSVGASRCVSPSGRVSTYSYDQYGRLSSISLAGQTITSYIYDTQQRGNTYLKYIQKTTHGGTATGNGTGSGLGLPSGDLVSRVIYDGLGREWITAEGPASGSGSLAGRIVTITGYDACGRKASEYLPYRISSSTVGLTSPVSAQSSWWDTYAGSGEGQYASVRHGYDNSLSPRSTWTVSPGSALADGTHAARETVSSNATGEVASLRYDESTGNVSVLGLMPAGTLRRTTTVTPDGDSTRVFTDARGITILERRFGEGGTENDTYFVPDRQGRFVWTISPVMANQVTATARQGLTPSYYPSGDDVRKYVFITSFDPKGDPQSAKVPGANVHAVTYDLRHLPVRDESPLMDGTYFHRFQNYDALGRPTFSFLVDSSRVDVIQPVVTYSLQASTVNAIGPVQQLEGIWDLAGTSYGQAVSNPYSDVQASHAFSSSSGIITSYSNDVAGDVISTRNNVIDAVFIALKNVDPITLRAAPAQFNIDPVSTDAASTVNYYDDLGRVVQQVTL